MSNIILGCDLDDCILETAKAIIGHMKEALPDHDFDEECIGKNFGVEKAFNLKEGESDPFVQAVLQSDIPPIPGAIKTLNWLTQFCPLIVVSFRRKYLDEHTRYTLDSLGLQDYELILTYRRKNGHTPSKAPIINEHHIDVMIEDRPDTIIDLYERTDADIIVFDRPWNQHIGECDRIRVAQDWSEIRNILKERIYNG